ncbi:MAG TPA: protoporphyrinogen oxidase [Acidimicrobiales bacterium]|nr:protoporphyrinogen oxidase [Acidimicrobiales bacterium]
MEAGGRLQRPTIAVIGGGIAGLAAAWELTGGSQGTTGASPRVVLLEATDHLGGKLRSGELDGQVVDLGPDGFLGRRPEATTLCREVGLGDDLVPIGTSGASVWARGRLRPLPDGLSLGVPTRFWPAARSGILGFAGSLRLLVDLISPRPDLRGPLGDRAIGPLVARKLGSRVVDRLVDPLVGGIHAGSVADMSAAAVFPLLLAVAQQRGSFMRALGRAAGPAAQSPAPPGEGPDGGAGPAAGGPASDGAAGPAFWALRGGMGTLVDRLAEVLTGRGVVIRTKAPVELIDRGAAPGSNWVLHTADGPVPADGIVLAVPAPAAAELLAPHDADAATLLRGIDHASVALVTLSYPEAAVPASLHGTGLLVPQGPTPVVAAAGGEGGAGGTGGGSGDGTTLITACTYLSRKWPHLARPGSVLIRASVGRLGDTRAESLDDPALVDRVVRELEVIVGLTARPDSWRVTRWPGAFPQYRVHHLLRVTGIESALKRLPAFVVAGAAYRGVGIPACIGSGRNAARSVLEELAVPAGEAGPAG